MAWKVGLLGGSWRDEEGDAVGFWEERPLRRLEAGDDMVCLWVDGWWERIQEGDGD